METRCAAPAVDLDPNGCSAELDADGNKKDEIGKKNSVTRGKRRGASRGGRDKAALVKLAVAELEVDKNTERLTARVRALGTEGTENTTKEPRKKGEGEGLTHRLFDPGSWARNKGSPKASSWEEAGRRGEKRRCNCNSCRRLFVNTEVIAPEWNVLNEGVCIGKKEARGGEKASSRGWLRQD